MILWSSGKKMVGIVIAGPTAVGKTAISIEVAKALDAEIISADSMQVYKKLDIGTAKISENEKQGIIHHLIDVVEPVHKFSVGEYYRYAGEILGEMERDNKKIVVAGGTGLYIDAVTEGIAMLPESTPELRKELLNKSLEELKKMLFEVDPESYCEIDLNNRRRVERAVEVFMLSGEKMSKLKRNNIKNNSYDFIKFALERDRELLYSRINKRVDIMFENGLYEEAKIVYSEYKEGINEIAAIGYRELFMHFKGEISLLEAKEMIKQNSRKYAKRQFTWFKNDPSYRWINLDEVSQEDAVKIILNEVK